MAAITGRMIRRSGPLSLASRMARASTATAAITMMP